MWRMKTDEMHIRMEPDLTACLSRLASQHRLPRSYFVCEAVRRQFMSGDTLQLDTAAPLIESRPAHGARCPGD
jgi:predicted transcriptional regulator